MPTIRTDLSTIAARFFDALEASAGVHLLRDRPTQVLPGVYTAYEGPPLEVFGGEHTPRGVVQVLRAPITELSQAETAWAPPEGGFPAERFGNEALLLRTDADPGVESEIHLVRDAVYALIRMPGTGGMRDWLFRLHIPADTEEAVTWTPVYEAELRPDCPTVNQVCFFHAEHGVQGNEIVAPVGEDPAPLSDEQVASHTADNLVHWSVPLRRAVVRRPCSYAELWTAWHAALSHAPYRERLGSWYDLTDSARYDQALAWLSAAATSTGIPSEGPPWARLWVGPWRHLWDEAEIPWSEHKEVVPADAEAFTAWRFQTGDVVELPLAAFLARAAPEEARRTHWGSLRFNAEGSFYLGTSVVNGEGNVPSDADDRLHDDMLAMRFQLLCGLARAAFYGKTPTFRGGFARSMLQQGSGRQIAYGRGFMYAATMAPPHHNQTNDVLRDTDKWKLHCYHWVRANREGACEACPRTEAFNGLPTTTRMTPGWVCTSAMTFFAHYITSTRYQVRGSSFSATAASDRSHLSTIGTTLSTSGDQQALVTALNDDDTDIRFISINGHEFSIVRLVDAADLMNVAAKPFASSLSSYNPLTGEPDAAGSTYFESTGLLTRLHNYTVGERTTVYSSVSCSPFKYRPIRADGVEANIRRNRVYADGRSRYVKSLYRPNAEALRAPWREPGPFAPVVFGYGNSSATVGDRQSHGDDLRTTNVYATRALPSPTMEELVRLDLYTTYAQARSVVVATRGVLQGAAGSNENSPTAFLGTLPAGNATGSSE